MNQPWLSVIIPTYNGAKYLAIALDSIVIQDELDIECIVVDDGSNDTTIEILNSYQDRIPLKIIQRPRIGNWVANTNYALSITTGERVCFLHQDDLWLGERLKIIKQLIRDYPQAALILHPTLFIDSGGNELGLWRCPLPKLPTTLNASRMLERLLIQNFIAIPAPIFHREIALKVGGLDERLWYTADWDFWLKLAFRGETVYYPEPLTAFRVHPDSQTIVRSSALEDFQKQLEWVARKHWELWEAPPSVRTSTWKIALFSIQVNTALAALVHRRKLNYWHLCSSFLALGLEGWYRYFRDSRIGERVAARVKTKLKTRYFN